jgi:short-subunit dehydrogenase
MPVYRKLMEINYFGAVSLVNLLLPHFAGRKSGHIAVISSMAGLMGFPQRTGYAAAKHALKGHFETLQTENKIPGLNVTIAYPGRINTPISLSALTGDGSLHNQMDEGQINGIPVDKCASRIIAAIDRKKRSVIIARGERILWWMWWFAPRLYYRIAGNIGNKT